MSYSVGSKVRPVSAGYFSGQYAFDKRQQQQQMPQETDEKEVLEGEVLTPNDARYYNQVCDGPYAHVLQRYSDVQNGFRHSRPTISLTV